LHLLSLESGNCPSRHVLSQTLLLSYKPKKNPT